MPKQTRLTRREFLTLAGASLGGAMLACGKSTPNLTESVEIPPSQPVPTTSVPTEVTALPPAAETPSPPPERAADTVLFNGRIMTMDSAHVVVQAIAICGDKILMTGSNETVQSIAAPSAKKIDLNGRVVTPGFIDPHLHFRALGLQNVYYIPFLPPEVKDIATLQQALAEVIRGKQSGEWIMGYYLGLSDEPIFIKEDLDPVSKSNPVFIMHIGGHWGTANSAALQIAKISNSTPNPPGGIIEKRDGEPTGVLYNHRAMDLLRVYAPPISADLVRQAILNTQTIMAACGVTSFHDNNIREVEHIQAYQELSREGSLLLRNDLYLTLEWPADLDKVSQVQPMDDGVTRFAGYKFLIDGQGPTAYCHQPHNGIEYRLPTWDIQMFKDIVLRLHETGLQICVHCIGDAATDLTLDAYEAAMNAHPRSDPRHRIEHAILTTPQATQRMRDLGIVISTQPAFIYLFGEGWESIFGTERMDRIMVTREWLDAGIHVAIGSDAPSMPAYNPQATLASSMSRHTYKKNAIGPDQTLTFEEALWAHTYQGAYAAHQEHLKGSLEAGKLADLVVWPNDPAQLPLSELALLTTVDMTMVGGKIVYQR
jgi:predicted amidohydrolase YtcJ